MLEPVPFTEEMREQGYTILAPQMAPIHFRFFIPILRRAGYNVRLLEHASKENIEVGLKYVNNDACYPALVVIGQLISQFTQGKVDPDRTAVAITQTGGMCRATNYASLLRKGLKDAGYPQVPVIAISMQGIEENPGFNISLPMMHKAIQAITIGDVLQKVVLRTRPYQIDGNVTALYERWDRIVREWLGDCSDPAGDTGVNDASMRAQIKSRQHFSHTLGKKLSFHGVLKAIVNDFDNVALLDIPRKPRVGMVGEILVQYHPDANNDAVGVIEREGCEAELPSLAQFFHQAFVTANWRYETLGQGTQKSRILTNMGLWAFQQYEKPMRAVLAESQRFDAGATIQELATKVQDIAQLGNQAGEGWYLTADMMDMIENGCPNIICAQPFACLPNHVVGKGMFHALRQKYPQANIVGIDYDPGASEVNQLNRIKLMISTAFAQRGHGEERLHFDSLAGAEPTSPDALDLDDAGYDPRAGGRTGAACGCGTSNGAQTPAGRGSSISLGMPVLRRWR